MPSPAVSFRQHSEAIVRDFLQTIMVVDDRAYFEEKESKAIPTDISAPGPPRFDTKASLDQETIQSDETELGQQLAERQSLVDKAHELNAKKLIEDFAVKGMVCAVIRPTDVEVASLQDKVYPLAENCDIVVFDWVLYGATDGAKVKELICEIAKRSSDVIKRLRLIVVYTGQEELADITHEIKSALENAGQNNVAAIGSFTLEVGPVRIAVYAKGYVPVAAENVELAERVIRIERLPDKLIAEFTDMTMGLVSNVAIGSMAALRSNTHKILTKFHHSLDAPFLSHRAMLPHPDDANDLLVYLIGAEMTAVLDGNEVGRIADQYKGLDVIRAWVEMHEAEMSTTAERGFAKKFSIRNAPEFIDNLCKLLRDGLSSKTVPPEFASMKDEPQTEKLTKKLSRSKTPDIALEHEFAILTTLKSDYRTKLKVPTLFPGTILKQIPSANGVARYWVCIQAICDCVRLEEPRFFPFLELSKDNGNFNLVLPDNDEFIRVRIIYKPYKLHLVEFGPTEGGSVRGVRDEGGIHFVSTERTHFSWLGELKFEQAQRIINKYATIQSRVGLEESEWLRRSATGTDSE